MTWQLQQYLVGATGRDVRFGIALSGNWLTFQPNGQFVCGYASFDAVSNRGRFVLGLVEYSNQWGAYSFTPHMTDRVRLHGQGCAEVYAFLKSLAATTGRFV